MTPGNIVGMAKVNGLDVIALTDHNCIFNIPAAQKIAEEYGITVIPGMELETSEAIHIICLFPDYAAIEGFYEKVKASYTPPDNRPEIFGRQVIYNEKDEPVGEHKPLLLASTGISIDEVFGLAEEFGGIAYPAHVDRDSYSVLSVFGALPYNYSYGFVEISKDCDPEVLRKTYPELENYRFICSSDAHYLDKISDRGILTLKIDEKSPENIIKSLKNSTF